jgi:hypothetical protein
MIRKNRHKCKECEAYYAFFIEALPTNKEEKELCEANNTDAFLRFPLNEKERKEASWYYSDDSFEYTSLPDSAEIGDYDFCKKCLRFIKSKGD